jgi:hypothetical protein
MTLTTTMTSRRLRLRRANPARLDLSVDRIVLAVATSFCAFLFVQGGFEALLGAGAGAAIAARARTSPVSGALAGLFAGALCAGFFHGAFVALVQPLF